MVNKNRQQPLSNEERREFLKVLGVGSAVVAGTAGLDDVRDAIAGSTSIHADLAPIGQTIQADLSGTLDAELLTSNQVAFTDAAATLTAVPAKGLPGAAETPREDFQQIAEAGTPVYDHLTSVGFFESTTNHLPEFTPEYIESSVKAFIGTETLAAPLHDVDFTDAELVDLLATVVNHRKRIGDRHWVSTDELPREQMEIGEHVPPMTQGAAGGILLWLEDLDQHLWQNHVLLTDEILADAVWNARAMAAGFQLMTEGARLIGEESAAVSDSDLAALLSSGFALQAIAQNLLREDVYWITEEMRAPSNQRELQFGGAN